MHIGVKQNGSWWNPKAYPSVPYLFNLLMDPLEKMDQRVARVGHIGRKFFASEDVGAERGRAVHRGAPEEPDGVPAQPGCRHAEHEEGAR